MSLVWGSRLMIFCALVSAPLGLAAIPAPHFPHADAPDWVQHPGTVPELLFIRRAPSATANGTRSRWSSHVAFPGGRQEPTDETSLYTALRETWEEIGIDLAESDFVQVGRLDEREITTSLGKRLLMILSPFGECIPGMMRITTLLDVPSV